jgi:hypothetical protein
MLDRGALLRQYHVQWPAMDAVLIASVMRSVMLLLIAVGLGWLLSAGARRLAGRPSAGEVSGD